MTTDTPTPQTDMTAGQFLMSLNGFDEIAIAARFGLKLADLRTEGEAITLGRALIFVDKRREGYKDPAAYEAAMSFTMQGVQDYFTPEKKKPKKKKRKADPELDGTPEDAEGKAS